MGAPAGAGNHLVEQLAHTPLRPQPGFDGWPGDLEGEVGFATIGEQDAGLVGGYGWPGELEVGVGQLGVRCSRRASTSTVGAATGASATDTRFRKLPYQDRHSF